MSGLMDMVTAIDAGERLQRNGRILLVWRSVVTRKLDDRHRVLAFRNKIKVYYPANSGLGRDLVSIYSSRGYTVSVVPDRRHPKQAVMTLISPP